MRRISWKNTVTVRVNNIEAFANECKKDNIVLENIRKTEKGYECTLDFASFRKIRKTVSSSNVRVRIVSKQGMGYYMRRRKRRYGFYFGALLAVVGFAYLTSCIWVVDIVGNDITPDSRILSVMNDNGIGIGKIRFGKKISKIKNNALIELDSLAWLWVNLDGTRAVVEVREKGESEKIIDKTVPSNLIASYPAQIVDMQVKSGRKVVERNSVVKKGDLLVSGVTETLCRDNRYIHSMGTVTGRTWRTTDGVYSYTDTVREPTGKEIKKYTLRFPKGKLKFGFGKLPDEYDKTAKHTRVKIFKNIYLPLTFTTETFCEIIEKNVELNEQQVLDRALSYLTERIESERTDGAHTVRRTYEYEKNNDGNLYVSVTLESLENIAEPIEIEVCNTEEQCDG